jgi:hypothetical protein
MIGLYRRTPSHSVLAPSRDDVSEIVTFSLRELYSLAVLRGSRIAIADRWTGHMRSEAGTLAPGAALVAQS